VYPNDSNDFNEENDTKDTDISLSETTEPTAAPAMKEGLSGMDNHNLDESQLVLLGC